MQTSFLRSYADTEGLENYVPQICFMGRSNSGKSSLLNALLKEKAAKISGKPGSTQLMNLFSYKSRFIIDLPGFGYAKISKSKKVTISHMLGNYLQQGIYQAGILLLDCKREPGDYEYYVAKMFRDKHKPLFLALSKCDKLNQKEKSKALRAAKVYEKDFHAVHLVSSHNGQGLETVESFYLSF